MNQTRSQGPQATLTQIVTRVAAPCSCGAGMGASKTPEQSNCHVAPLYLLMGDPPFPGGNGRYYGSDAVRSPLDRYRGPGDPPYVADD